MLRDADILTYSISGDEAEGGEYLFEDERDARSVANTARFRALLSAAIEERGSTLQRLIAPMSARQFVAERWAESATRFQNEHNRGLLPTLLSIEGLRAGLTADRYRREDYRFVRRQRYQEDDGFYPATRHGLIDAAETEKFFREKGGSIVIDHCHRYHEPVNALWQELMAVFRFPVTCTVYYTPPSHMTFPVHWDTDDVFVLQLQGRKFWSIYDPVIRDPLEHHQWGKYDYELGPPVLETILEPGDVLYVPRGHPHGVVAHPDEASLQITVGVCLPTWHMCLKLLLQKALLRCGQHEWFRQPCPLILEPEGSISPNRSLEEIAREWPHHLTVNALREAAEDFVTQHVLTGLAETEDVTPPRDPARSGRGRRYRRRPRLFFFHRAEQGLVLKFAGKVLVFPITTEEAVRHVVRGGTVRAEDLPGGLDAEERHILIERLEREGFLTESEPRRTEPRAGSP